eukprot:g13984.t1
MNCPDPVVLLVGQDRHRLLRLVRAQLLLAGGIGAVALVAVEEALPQAKAEQQLFPARRAQEKDSTLGFHWSFCDD